MTTADILHMARPTKRKEINILFLKQSKKKKKIELLKFPGGRRISLPFAVSVT